MRYIMKGGVWKNSEDQILKAAIMKYGLNQWSRISSLLQRKSAKQCKQRWYQWLDPSIKKTQWTRAQDQKLLQLARVFPSQWRTISPFVGRTPTQCYERYEKLLDMAQGKSIKQTQDLKKLRPGQIDPNPQTKPARLDPIDMDQDQKEMLAQVRVRLANTKGKKAKRKQRQKIIEEARRLAQLQKIRQLEMAGVDNVPTAKQIKRMKQNKSIDYNKQIPFKRQIPEFKYSHQNQNQSAPRGTSFANTISLQTLQGKRRDVQQELQRKLDKRRMKKLKERDLKTVMIMKNTFEKPVGFPVQLPQPQITDKDLQQMKNYNIKTPLNSHILSNSGQTPFGMTPNNKLMFSAKVNMSLNHHDMADDDLDGVQALNYLKIIQKQQKLGLNQPLRSINRIISQRMKTPLTNEWQGSDSQLKIKNLFKNLSKPQNQIQFQIPQQQNQQDQQQIIDAEQVQRAARKQNIQQRQNNNKKKSKALKQNLPRSKYVVQKILNVQMSEIQKLILQQMLSLIYSDALDYPIQNTIFPDIVPKYKDNIDIELLNEASKLVQEQIKHIKQQKSEIQIQQIQKIRKKIKINFKSSQTIAIKKQINIKQKQTQIINKYLIDSQIYGLLFKQFDNNTRKTKKIIGGYQKIIKNKFEEVKNLSYEIEKIKREKNVLQQIKKVQTQSIKNRFNELNQYYKIIYKAI